jgi:hypothetical protein
MTTRMTTALVLVLTVLIPVGCGSDSTGPDEESMAQYILGLQTATGTRATFNNSDAPQAGTGVSLNVTYLGETIIGGTSQASVTSSQQFQRVVVTIEGVKGYYELMLPSATTSATMLVTFAQDPPRQNFTTKYAGGASGNAAIGAYSDAPVALMSVGTGEIQISVSWDAPTDVDLHVVEPGGVDIYYGNPTSPSGGELDLDSNPACFIDGVNNENITWGVATPPRGTYTVRLDYFDACGEVRTNYVVTVNIRGRQPMVFTGSFTGPGDGGGAGDGITITSFTY